MCVFVVWCVCCVCVCVVFVCVVFVCVLCLCVCCVCVCRCVVVSLSKELYSHCSSLPRCLNGDLVAWCQLGK